MPRTRKNSRGGGDNKLTLADIGVGVGTAAAVSGLVYAHDRIQQKGKTRRHRRHRRHSEVKPRKPNKEDEIFDYEKWSNLEIIPNEFESLGQQGDFSWEIKHGTHPRALYIFNDNHEDHITDKAGSGNAVIRKYNRYSNKYKKYPFSAGVQTGSYRLKGAKKDSQA